MSAEPAALEVVLCWHMHQPAYRDPVTGRYHLPWTYLHAIKDYTDMAAHLEAEPRARAVVNFAPILLEQLDDYAANLAAHLEGGAALADPLLAALAAEAAPVEAAARRDWVAACLRANRRHLIERFPRYRALADTAEAALGDEALLMAQPDPFFFDLLVWYHLAWLGESVRRDHAAARDLLARERDYGPAERRALLELIHGLIAGIVPRYRALAVAGRVELSMTPYAHPILPLLMDLGCAREAVPELVLPAVADYPGGEARARWQVARGREVFQAHFGFAPVGCWPAEGGVSAPALDLLAEYGFAWVASGEGVLRNSLGEAVVGANRPRWLNRPYRLEGRAPSCFFRDDELSDLIGFSYGDWHADDAVADLVHRLGNIAEAGPPGRVVSIILDGENAWEHYPENGYFFLSALYRRLAEDPRLRLTTFRDAGAEPARLDRLVAGSWVYGSFTTWIGDPAKNRAWELLVEAKTAFDAAVAAGRLQGGRYDRAARQLAVCEGSDWCWWFGDYNAADTVRDFDRLYRRQLAALYALIDAPVPDALGEVVSRGGGAPPLGGAMRPGREA